MNSESDVTQIYDCLETCRPVLAQKIFGRYESDDVCSLAEDGAACAD